MIAARSPEKAERAAASIRLQRPGAALEFVRLDLADLASVAEAAAVIAPKPVDGIVANAAVLPWDRVSRTVDGFEPAMGTNHLGHFALLARVLPAIVPGGGIVSLGSMSAIGQRLRLDDLSPTRPMASYDAYGKSKLAVMTFAAELDRRLRTAGRDQRSVIAHPGLRDRRAVAVPSGDHRPGQPRLPPRGLVAREREGPRRRRERARPPRRPRRRVLGTGRPTLRDARRPEAGPTGWPGRGPRGGPSTLGGVGAAHRRRIRRRAPLLASGRAPGPRTGPVTASSRAAPTRPRGGRSGSPCRAPCG